MDEFKTAAAHFLRFVENYREDYSRIVTYQKIKDEINKGLYDPDIILKSKAEWDKLLREINVLSQLKDNYKSIIREKNELEIKLTKSNTEISNLQNKIKKDKSLYMEEHKKKEKEIDKKNAEIQELKNQNETLIRSGISDEERKGLIKEIEDKESELRDLKQEKEELTSHHNAKIGELTGKINKLTEWRTDAENKIKDYQRIAENYEYIQNLNHVSMSMSNLKRERGILSPAQKEIVNSVSAKEDFLIRGGSGSGKTFVLLAIIERLKKESKEERSQLTFDNKENKDDTFKLLTFTNSLVNYSKYIYPDLSEKQENLHIETVDKFIYQVCRVVFNKKIIFDKDVISNLNSMLDVSTVGGCDIAEEINAFIWAKGVSKEAYVDNVCPRKGMDTALAQEHRQVVWKELERIESQLQRKDEWPSNYVAKKLVEHFDKQPDIFERYKNDYILVDEYQDIPPIKLKLLKHLARKAIYLAGDVNQSIYKRPYYSFAEIGIDISGRSRILTESFRNTYQINAVAQKYKELAGIADIEENMTSSRSGLPVKLFSGSTDECIDTINKVTRNLVYLGTNPKDICIVVYSNDQVNKVIKHFSKADDGDDNLDIEIINTENSDSFFDNNSIKISTIHSIKGLEFPNILFLADYDLHQSIIRGKNTSEIELLEKYLIYVAITRANSFLYVFSNKGKENKYKANIALINAINETNSVYN